MSNVLEKESHSVHSKERHNPADRNHTLTKMERYMRSQGGGGALKHRRPLNLELKVLFVSAFVKGAPDRVADFV